jgi:hypothetical protein
VTVPEGSGTSSKTYHSGCFKCNVCQGVFKETGAGKAIFVTGENGACHPEVKSDPCIKHCIVADQI